MSNLVGNPEDRFSHNEAHLENEQQRYVTGCVFVVQIGLKQVTDLSKAVLLMWFSMLHVLESVSVLFSPSMCLDVIN